MTIQELIEALQAYDPTMRVMVDGYEGGYNDVQISNFYTNEIALNIGSHKGVWYYGPHETASDVQDDDSHAGIVTALILGR